MRSALALGQSDTVHRTYESMPRNGGAIRAGISTKEDIKAPFLTRFAFIIVNACMISLAAVGVLLTAAGAIYRTSVGDNGLGMCAHS